MSCYDNTYKVVSECFKMIKNMEDEEFTVKTFLDMVNMCEELGVDIDLSQVENVFNIFKQATKITSRAGKCLIRRPILLKDSEVDARKRM